MPSTARQLRQPPTIEAIGRVPYFADVGPNYLNVLALYRRVTYTNPYLLSRLGYYLDR
jgi:hypothetical protein